MTSNPTFRAAREVADAFDDSMPLADRARLASLISERFRKLVEVTLAVAEDQVNHGKTLSVGGRDKVEALREALKEVL